MNLRIFGLPAIAALVSCFLISAAHATPPLYRITDLGTFGGNSFGYGINASGEVTGYSEPRTGGVYIAFLYNGTTLVDLGTLGGTNSVGQSINATGEVTGWSQITGDSAYHAFLYNGSTIVDLGTLGGTNSYGYGINDSSAVTGQTQTPQSGGSGSPFLYNGTAMQGLGTLGGTIGYGYAINNAGEVTGQTSAFGLPGYAFLWNGTTALDLGALGTSTFSAGLGINANGEVTGASYLTEADSGPTHAFLYNGIMMVDLGTLGGSTSQGNAVNDSGEVVGLAFAADGTQHAFFYHDGAMLDINDLISATDPLYSDIVFFTATGINDAGQIVANGCYLSGSFSGECHAFRLDPVPVFAGTPGKSNCHGKSVSALAQQYGGLNAAAAALGFASGAALQNAIMAYCGG
jgi:probable HAF family extracellular repeat protein